jgi:hypothetical protein
MHPTTDRHPCSHATRNPPPSGTDSSSSIPIPYSDASTKNNSRDGERLYIFPHPKSRPQPKSTHSRFFLRPSLGAVMTRISRRKRRKKTKKSARKTTHIHGSAHHRGKRAIIREAGGGQNPRRKSPRESLVRIHAAEKKISS